VSAPSEIRTRRLCGRAVTLDDLPYVLETDSDIRVQRWIAGVSQTAEQSRARLQRWTAMWAQDGMGFWIFRDASGEAVAHGGVFRSPRVCQEIEVGYAVKPAYWGLGYATEIAQASLHVAFDDLGLERVIAICRAAHAASRRVLEKCGMTLEGPEPDGNGVRYVIESPAFLAHQG
jgi:RimJ/RimL family protein N-acetyltransferase